MLILTIFVSAAMITIAAYSSGQAFLTVVINQTALLNEMSIQLKRGCDLADRLALASFDKAEREREVEGDAQREDAAQAARQREAEISAGLADGSLRSFESKGGRTIIPKRT